MKLVKAMATVGGLTALSRVAGFARDILTAAILGAGPIADAFFVALKLPNFFRRVTAEGAFSVSFVPLYSEAMEKEGRESADAFAGNAMVIMFWILLFFTVVFMIAMPLVIMLIAPGFADDPTTERFDLAVTLSRITFPYLLMMSIASLMGGVLNAHGKFAPFAAAPILFNLALIGVLFVAWKFETAAHALAVGVLIAGVLQFVLLYFYIRRHKIKLPLVRPKFDGRIKKLFKLMGPGVLGAGIMQINLFADMIMGSFLPIGSISYLYYADRLNQLPLSTVGIAVGTALLPMLSKAINNGRTDEARGLFNRSLEVTMFLGLPAAVGLFMLADIIMSVLFERGAFTAEDAAATAFVLQGYVIGLPAYIAVKVFATAFFSQQDTMTPVKISIIVTVTNIVLAITLIQFIGVAGIALATGLVGWLHLGLLARPLGKNEAMKLDDRFKRVLPRIIFATGAMMAVVMMAKIMLHPWAEGLAGEIYKDIALAIFVSVGMITYTAAIFASGALSMTDIRGFFKKSQ
jgi:putative peptidoglycan lipid II flippase